MADVTVDEIREGRAALVKRARGLVERLEKLANTTPLRRREMETVTECLTVLQDLVADAESRVAAGEDAITGWDGDRGGLGFPLVHRGLRRFRERLRHPASDIEKGLADQWEHEAAPSPGINDGNGILQCLMYEPAPEGDTLGCLGRRGRYVFRITQREATIVATVIQWLGSNVGRAFLQMGFRRAGYYLTYRKVEERPHG